MANHQNNRPRNVSHPEISPELLQQWLDQQSNRIELEKAEARIKEKELESNERLAMRSLDYQARDIKAQPGESRKSFLLFCTIIFVFTIHALLL